MIFIIKYRITYLFFSPIKIDKRKREEEREREKENFGFFSLTKFEEKRKTSILFLYLFSLLNGTPPHPRSPSHPTATPPYPSIPKGFRRYNKKQMKQRLWLDLNTTSPPQYVFPIVLSLIIIINKSIVTRRGQKLNV